MGWYDTEVTPRHSPQISHKCKTYALLIQALQLHEYHQMHRWPFILSTSHFHNNVQNCSFIFTGMSIRGRVSDHDFNKTLKTKKHKAIYIQFLTLAIILSPLQGGIVYWPLSSSSQSRKYTQFDNTS